MEIFLLLVVIILLIIFNGKKKTRLSLLEQKLSHIENYLKTISLNQQKPPVQKTDAPAETLQKIIPPAANPVVPPPEEEKKPVVHHEKISPVFKEPEMQPPVQQKDQVKVPLADPQRRAVAPIHSASRYEKFRKNNPDLEKFIGENILSKIAIVILVLGIAFFVKYAIDQEWINEVARVGIGILCGGIVLGFAHRLHKKFKAFSSVLVAGGIAVFYFTIGIGFHQYQLFNQATAFLIMLLITAFSVFISIVYDRVELAALSIIGGFATPFMASSGGGNYQVLFVYVLILDSGMLALAYLRKWNLINILAYCFTMVLYFSWLETRVIGEAAAPYRGALFFGAVFYIVFVLMNMVNNVKERRKFGTFDISILLSNTFLFYGSGMQILLNYHPELRGLFSGFLALFNLVCAWLLYKKFKADDKLVYLMIGLTLTFITLVAPVQLHGNYITIFWALEAVLLMWLAQKSEIILYRLVSVIITFLMLLSLIMDWASVYATHEAVPVLLNKAFITGFTSSLCLLGIALLLRKEQEVLHYLGVPFHPKNYRTAMGIGFIVLLYLSGLLELIYQLQDHMALIVARFIVISAYHLLFISALNLAGSGLRSQGAKAGIHLSNFISCLVFLIGFALLPVFDFKENMLAGQMNYTGFIFHYVSLCCSLFIAYRMYLFFREQTPHLKNYQVVCTVLLSAGLTYLCSIELVLHVLQLELKPVAGRSEIITKLNAFTITCTHVVKIGFPVLWGLLAFAFLFIGMKKQSKTLRILALALIAITLVKLFTFDIQHASEGGKIIAFILLGIVLLVISFMYQKIKALLLDDSKTDPVNKDQS